MTDTMAVTGATGSMAVDVLLFDLGGVLIDYSGVQDLAALLPARAPDAEIRARWSRCPHTEAFGLGRMTRDEFGERFVQHWGIRLPPEQFLREFRSWPRSFLPGAVELLATLRPRVRLAALSNSNELHWERNTDDLGLNQFFELAISSHEVGLGKPDPRIYELALKRLGVPAEAVMFFDDATANVRAASALGMRAFQVDGVDDVRARLIKEGLL